MHALIGRSPTPPARAGRAALSAGLAFGSTPPAAGPGLANAASHAGKTVPVAGATRPSVRMRKGTRTPEARTRRPARTKRPRTATRRGRRRRRRRGRRRRGPLRHRPEHPHRGRARPDEPRLARVLGRPPGRVARRVREPRGVRPVLGSPREGRCRLVHGGSERRGRDRGRSGRGDHAPRAATARATARARATPRERRSTAPSPSTVSASSSEFRSPADPAGLFSYLGPVRASAAVAPDDRDRVLEAELRDRQVLGEVGAVHDADAADDVRRPKDVEQPLDRVGELLLGGDERVVAQSAAESSRRRPVQAAWASSDVSSPIGLDRPRLVGPVAPSGSAGPRSCRAA